MSYNRERPLFTLPLRGHQYYVSGVTSVPQKGYDGRYFHSDKQAIHYGLQPYWKRLADDGPLTGFYGVEEVSDRGVCVVIPFSHDRYARGLAALLGMDIMVTVPRHQADELRDFLKDRGARFVETISFANDPKMRVPFNLEDSELDLSTEIKLSMENVEIRRSKLASRLVGREADGEVLKVLEHFVETSPL